MPKSTVGSIRQTIALGWNVADLGQGKVTAGTWLHSFVPQRDLCGVVDRVALLHRRAAPHDLSPAQLYCLTQKGIQRVKNGFASHRCLQVAVMEGRW